MLHVSDNNATTLAALKRLIAESFFQDRQPDSIADDDRLFQDGLGLNSLQGVELLVQIEDRFGIVIDAMDWTAHEMQTVESLSTRIDTLKRQTAGRE